MPDDEKPASNSDRGHPPTLDEDEQGDRSLALIDSIYDAAQDEALDSDEPVSAAAERLAVAARLMMAKLTDARRASQRTDIEAPTRVNASSSGNSTATAPEGGAVARPCLSPDTGRILALSRDELEELVTALQHQRGEAAVLAYDAFSDDDLRRLARALRPPTRGPGAHVAPPGT